MKRIILLIAVGYPLLLLSILALVASIDPFLVFDSLYTVSTGVIAPALATTFFVMLHRREGGPGLLKTLALIGWIITVTILHFWLIALIASGV